MLIFHKYQKSSSNPVSDFHLIIDAYFQEVKYLSKEIVPVAEKYLLTINEAASYFNIGAKKICDVKTYDPKLFLIKLQSDGKGYSIVKTVRGVLRPAFQMAVDDDLINKNPFGFQLAGVVVNNSVTRETIKKDEMRKSGQRLSRKRKLRRRYAGWYNSLEEGWFSSF